MLSLRLLHTFTIVAEELHFGRAAERLHMTQPPLSQQIRQLEQLVNAELFYRSTRSVKLTPAGKVLLERARKLLLDAESACRAVQLAERGDAGTIALGFTASSTYVVLPRLISEFRDRYPAVELKLQELPPETLLDDLHGERLDVALLRPPAACFSDTRLTLTSVARESLVLAMRVDHPLAHLDVVPIALIDQLPFIGFSPSNARYSYELCQRIFASNGVQPQIVQESIMPTMLALVAAGIGAALVPASAQAIWTGALHYRRLAGNVDDVTTLYAARLGRVVNQAAENFVSIAATLDYTATT